MAEMTLEGVDARPEDSAFALGRVHSIETMGTVDGPGIRFVVFVQGCPMRCAYCHNPDTWSVNGGTMVTVEHLMDEFQSNHEFYRNGLKEYINDNGYNVTYPSIVSGGAPNMTSIKNMVDNDQIAVLFVSGYTLLSTNDYSKTDTHDQLYKSIY